MRQPMPRIRRKNQEAPPRKPLSRPSATPAGGASRRGTARGPPRVRPKAASKGRRPTPPTTKRGFRGTRERWGSLPEIPGIPVWCRSASDAEAELVDLREEQQERDEADEHPHAALLRLDGGLELLLA